MFIILFQIVYSGCFVSSCLIVLPQRRSTRTMRIHTTPSYLGSSIRCVLIIDMLCFSAAAHKVVSAVYLSLTCFVSLTLIMPSQTRSLRVLRRREGSPSFSSNGATPHSHGVFDSVPPFAVSEIAITWRLVISTVPPFAVSEIAISWRLVISTIFWLSDLMPWGPQVKFKRAQDKRRNPEGR